MIKLNDVTFKYDKVILENINLEIFKSKVTYIVHSSKCQVFNFLHALFITNNSACLSEFFRSCFPGFGDLQFYRDLHIHRS